MKRTIKSLKMAKEKDPNIVKLANELAIFFAYNEKDIDIWLNEYAPALGSKPSELLGTSEGRNRLIRCLEAMKYGDF